MRLKLLKDHPFYVASALGNYKAARALITYMESLGAHCTFNWPAVYERYLVTGESTYSYPELAAMEIGAVQKARTLVLLLPVVQGGFVELGVALATHTPVLVLGDPAHKTDARGIYNIFWDHPGVKHVSEDPLAYNEVVNELLIRLQPREW